MDSRKNTLFHRFASIVCIAAVAISAIFIIAPDFVSAAELKEVKITEADGKLIVEIGGEPFTEYVFKSGNKPILWPVYGPTGANMTRGYPMAPAKDTERPTMCIIARSGSRTAP